MKIFLNEVRTQKNVSIRKLSELSGVAVSYIERLEGDKEANPTIDIICKLAKALEVPASELFTCD